MVTAVHDAGPSLSPERLAQIDASIAGLAPQQLWWASGYIAGLAAGRSDSVQPLPDVVAAPAPAPGRAEPLTVLYASETGNSRRVAGQLADAARAQGTAVTLADLSTYKPRQLKRERRVAFVVATHGLGDAPDGTEAFFDYWGSDSAPRLTELEFSVLALGDSSYDDYCQVGRDLDARLEALGARRIHDRIDCDVDFEANAQQWSSGVLQLLEESAGSAARVTAVPQLRAVPVSSYGRERPFEAEVLAGQKITGRESTKDVRHFELSLEDSGLSYAPGDSLGVVPRNPPQLVEELLAATGYRGEQAVQVAGRELPLAEALDRELEITVVSRAFVDAYATHSPGFTPPPRGPEGRQWLSQRQVIDIVSGHAAPDDPQQFVDCLRKLTPRLYSIASSPDANPDEAHLTVRLIDYQAHGRRHWGAASTFLAANSTVPVFIEENDRFRLPANGDTPIIMIGAGTGVAPFRAFIEQRLEHGNSGKNWLFFGDRNQRSDFLYQLEWLRYRKDGVLTRMDLAFSRDQARKIYVQDRIRENAAQLYAWLDAGAHIYVCGDAEQMAPAVDAALADVVAGQNGVSDEDATQYLKELRRDGRYQRDVY